MSKSKTQKDYLGLVPLMPLYNFLLKTFLLIIEKTKKGYTVDRQSLNSKEEFAELLVYIKPDQVNGL